MRRVGTMIVALLMLTVTAWGQDSGSGPDGSVSGYTPSAGTMRGSFTPDAAIESRDIFTIVQKGTPIGEAMVIKVGSKGECTLLPKGNLKGTPRVGDTLRFARHAEMPVDGTESWETYTAPEFSVCVPAPMAGPETKTDAVSEGRRTSQTWLSIDNGDETVYLVKINRYSMNRLGDNHRWVQPSLENNLMEIAKQQGGSVNWTRPVKGEKNPSCDFELTLKDGIMARGRLILVHTTSYGAFAVVKGKGVSTRTWKFVNSFKITPKD